MSGPEMESISGNCLLVVGEKSGEEHCLSFLPRLRALRPDISFWGVGGEQMRSQGVSLLYHLKEFSSWGYSEVIKKIPFYFQAMKTLEREVRRRKTRVAILVDFQEFNLKLAQKLSALGVQVLYYVAPQAWVWRPKRTRILARTVHTLFALLPFEKEWFGSRGVERVVHVSHPLWNRYRDHLLSRRPTQKKKDRVVHLLLLPGSRNAEVNYLLPEFVRAAQELGREVTLKVSLVASESVNKKCYAPYIGELDTLYGSEQLTDALHWADCALASNGTVTLATALFGVPTVAAYKVTLFNEFIFHTFLSYKKLTCLANIVHGEEIFPELLQNRATSFNMKEELLKWVKDEQAFERVVEKLSRTVELIKGEVEESGELMGELVGSACDC